METQQHITCEGCKWAMEPGQKWFTFDQILGQFRMHRPPSACVECYNWAMYVQERKNWTAKGKGNE